MRARILEAAVRVLHDEGALSFTTTRVADEAGISVGSLYQYFPNKHALVVALHRDAIRRGWEHVRGILDGHPGWSPRRKVTEISKWFFATESGEAAELGPVFEDVDVFVRDAGDHALEAEVLSRFTRFVAESSRRPRTPAALRFDAQLLVTTLESVGKAVATQPLSAPERDRWAVATATMLCDHLAIGTTDLPPT
jgi:AcrR family transcriptional regulator